MECDQRNWLSSRFEGVDDLVCALVPTGSVQTPPMLYEGRRAEW